MIAILLLPFCNNPLLIVVMLPVVAIRVVVPKFPVFAFPVTLKAPAVVKLPPLTLPVAATTPAVVKLPPDTLPVAVIRPAVPKLPTLALPVTDNTPPVDMLPALALPVTVNEVSEPTLVIFGCAAVVTVPAVVAAPLSVAVMMFALKLPSASRITTVFPVAAVAVLNPSSKSAFKFVTLVVDATTNGAVPVATFDSNVEATTLPAVLRLPALALPVTVNEVNEPTLVMFGCAAVLNGPVNTLAPITPEFA